MAEVLLFHHALGLTEGSAAFAERLRSAGHIVHLPDLYAGRTFTDLAEGVAHAEELGAEVLERGRRAAEGLGSELVYAGLSLGVMPAQMLAQQRPGARAALLVHSAVPLGHFGAIWPEGVPLQMHTMADDAWGDVEVAQDLAQRVEGAELFLYPGGAHLFTDRTTADHDEAATALLIERALALLDRVG